jgi:peptidoglycan/xylan/chitin deacetylase (PgdA/CDA1 family)/SAM-dependent methyltransferase
VASRGGPRDVQSGTVRREGSSPKASLCLPAPLGGADLLATLDSLERQTLGSIEVCWVVADDDPPLLRDFLSRLARGPLRRALTVGPGLGWAARANAVLGAARSEFAVLLDPGDLLAPTYLELATAACRADPAIQVVAPWVRREDSLGDPELQAAGHIELETLLAETWALPLPSVFRTAAWRELGGLVADVEPLALYEFWLRVLARGGRVHTLAAPLVVRRLGRNSAELQRLDRGAHAAAWTQVFERHRALFEGHLEAVLLERQRRLQTRTQRYQSALAARDAGVAELGELTAEIAALRAGTVAIDWGELRRSAPVSREWGEDRGVPLDRHYIETFLAVHQADVGGSVLEVQEDDFTRRFGGPRVTHSEIVDIEPGNPRATVLADLRATGLPGERYDCVILTQTLHVIDDMPAVLAEVRRLLKPGGVLLATMPTASRVCVEYGPDGDFCRLTAAGARQLFETTFAPDELEITTYGNLLATVAFLHGFARHELRSDEYARQDPWYPLVIGVRATKGVAAAPAAEFTRARAAGGRGEDRGVILLYHRVVVGGEAEVPDPHGMAVSLAEFLRQMAHLKERYLVLPLAVFAEQLSVGQLPRDAVALTFDDAYLDNLDVVSPVLLDLKLPATFFAVSSAAESGEPFWWDRLAASVLAGDPLPDPLELEVGARQLSLSMRTPAARLATYYALHAELVQAPTGVRAAALDALPRPVRRPTRAAEFPRPLRAAELRELARRSGHSIGAHGADHLALTTQSDAVQRQELQRCREELAALLGKPIAHLAYPYGAADRASADHARAAGFSVAVTCEARAARRGDDPLLLPRIEVRPGEDLAALLRGAFRS